MNGKNGVFEIGVTTDGLINHRHFRKAVKKMKTPHYLVVDAMQSGTGVRDELEGEYLDRSQLEISADLVSRISEWLQRYKTAHYSGFKDKSEVQKLDIEGLSIAQALKDELPTTKVSYFSDAYTKILRWSCETGQ